jgi:hypothetical protein
MPKIGEVDVSHERYNYNQTKSTVVVFGNPQQRNIWPDNSIWELSGKLLDVSEEETHLGLIQTPKNKIVLITHTRKHKKG